MPVVDDNRIGTLGATAVPFPPAGFFPGGKSVVELEADGETDGVPFDSVVADEAVSSETYQVNCTRGGGRSQMRIAG